MLKTYFKFTYDSIIRTFFCLKNNEILCYKDQKGSLKLKSLTVLLLLLAAAIVITIKI